MPYVNYRKEGPVVTVEMDRPERLNAMGTPIYDGLCDAWLRFQDDPDARVAVLTSSGRAFCAGLDVKEVAETGQRPRSRPEDPFYGRRLLKPVIGAARGYALGAGLTLLLACDLRVCGESTVLGMPEILRGFIAGGTPFPPQRLPSALTMELNLLGFNLTAQRAYRAGLINRVVPDGDVLSAAYEMAGKVAQMSPGAIASVKRTLYQGIRIPDAVRIQDEMLFKESFGSRDALEGARAWVERRAPQWKGE